MLHHLDIGPLIYNQFCDATSSRQFLMTVRICYIIDVYPDKYLLRVYLYLSIDSFSLSLELVKEIKRYTSKT